MGADGWLGVELRHFLALEAVAREGSFGKAAAALGYTQSAVSQQIATLERIVGHRLIERPGGPKPVSLTEAGSLLLTHAGAIAARIAAAQADLNALGEGQAGTLRVGVFQSVGQRILPGVMHRFVAAWPQVSVTLTESADDLELLSLVERGDLDLTFADLPLAEGPFESVELLRDPYVLVVPAGSPLTQRETAPTWREMAELDLIGHKHCSSLAQLESDARRPLRFVFRSDVIAPAEVPVEMNAFKSQQHRWAKGSIQTCCKLLPRLLRANLPIAVKAEAFFHLTANFNYP